MADREALDQALERLQPENRALIVMHYYLGMSLPEAAASMGITLGAAKSRLHHAIVSLGALRGGAGDATATARGGPA